MFCNESADLEINLFDAFSNLHQYCSLSKWPCECEACRTAELANFFKFIGLRVIHFMLVFSQLSSLRFCYCSPYGLAKELFSANRHYALIFYVDIIYAPYAKKCY
jgi:hypothetical protein